MAERTGEEGSNTENRFESGLFRNSLILKAMVDVQRIRKHNRLLARDTLVVVEIPHHFHEVHWIARILTDAGVDLRISLRGMSGGVAVAEGSRDGGLCLCLALRD